MKFTRSELTSALVLLNRVITPECRALPILANILMEPQQETIQLTTTDLETGVVLRLGTPEPKDRPVAVPARKLLALLRALPKPTQDLSIQCGDNFAVNVAGITLAGAAPEAFPTVQCDVTATPHPVMGLVAAFRCVAPAMLHDTSGDTLNGAYVNLPQGVVVATDRHRFHRVQVPRATLPARAAIIPRAAVILAGHLGRFLRPPERMTITEKAICIPLINGGFLVARTLDGKYPNYGQVVPTPPHALTTSRIGLIGTITNAAVVSEGRNKSVTLLLRASPAIHAASPDVGETTLPLPDATYTGPDCAIGFNARYLLAALDACVQETVTIRVTDAESLCRIDDGAFTAVIMPLRI